MTLLKSYLKKDFVKGMTKGAGALGVGLATRLTVKAVSSRPLVITLDSINPLAGAAGFAGFAALVGGLIVSGNAESGSSKHSNLKKLVGYGILAAVGASLDPDPPQTPTFVPRQYTQVPVVAAEYQDWIPQYAPSVTFPRGGTTPPNSMVLNPYQEVPRFSNVF